MWSASVVNIRCAAAMSLFQPCDSISTSVPVPMSTAAATCAGSAGLPSLVNSTAVYGSLITGSFD
jgi:hypothetical protein